MTTKETNQVKLADNLEIISLLLQVEDLQTLFNMFQEVVRGIRENYIVEIFGGEGNIAIHKDKIIVTDLSGEGETGQVFVGNSEEIYNQLQTL